VAVAPTRSPPARPLEARRRPRPRPLPKRRWLHRNGVGDRASWCDGSPSAAATCGGGAAMPSGGRRSWCPSPRGNATSGGLPPTAATDGGPSVNADATWQERRLEARSAGSGTDHAGGSYQNPFWGSVNRRERRKKFQSL
jgi:hypothetical protein